MHLLFSISLGDLLTAFSFLTGAGLCSHRLNRILLRLEQKFTDHEEADKEAFAHLASLIS